MHLKISTLTQISLTALVLALPAFAPAQSFPLTDSGPAAPDFRERFFGSYGIHSEIEPAITEKDRPLYEKVEPFLRTDPRRAAKEVQAGLTPDSSPAFDFLLGNLYYQTGQLSQSERSLQNAIRKFPDFRRAYRTLGFIQVQKDDYDAAVATWLKVIALGGGDAQSYGLLAYAYLLQEKYQSALSAYEMARMFKPDSMDFRRGQAQCLLQLDRHEEAAGLFNELIGEKPGEADLWLLQANTFIELERFDDAIANLEVLQSKGEASRQAMQLLGDLHLRNDNHLLALQTYEASLVRYGVDDLKIALRPLNFFIGRGLYDEAERYLGALRSKLPSDLDAASRATLTVVEASLSIEKDELGAAIRALEPVVKADPLNGEALLLLAEAFRRDQNFAEAEFYLERVLSLPDEKHNALVALGRIEVDQGDFKAALEYLREAYSLKPTPNLQRYIEAIVAAR